MKKNAAAAFFLMLVTLFCACDSRKTQSDPRLVQVFLEEADSYSVKNNGRKVLPGEDASFILKTRNGISVISADYEGEYLLKENEDGTTQVTLRQVRYPTRVRLTVSRDTNAIRYIPNGGQGEELEIVCDTTRRKRVNTSQGAQFMRPGYTLVGWNTEPDGNGTQVGLGSRIEIPPDGLTLYAQWAEWTDADAFTWRVSEENAVITDYHGAEQTLVIPAELAGLPVRTLAENAFAGCEAETVIFPASLRCAEPGAFSNSALQTLILFDSIEQIGDRTFSGCTGLKTLSVQAIEDPYGARYRRESVFADKIDLLICAQGQKKIVFYGGCSTWYNLIGSVAEQALGDQYTILNLGLNGLINSKIQMDIIGHYLEEGDIFVHAPEIASRRQLLLDLSMSEVDDRLWSGIEYDYDLLSFVDLREITGVFDSWCDYLAKKEEGGGYQEMYRDNSGNLYMDSTGSIPVARAYSSNILADSVSFHPEYYTGGLPALKAIYEAYQRQGVRIYVTAAVIDIDQVPIEQRSLLDDMERLYRQTFEQMDGVMVISQLADYIYHDDSFYDTVYHLLSREAYQCTEHWIADLTGRMEEDGLLT